MQTVLNLATDDSPADTVRHTVGTGLVGCAGWSIPRRAGALFPAEGSHLERYGAVFGAVEINSSFYRSHRPSSYERWAASVPPEFRFCVKVPRTITHQSRLVDVGGQLVRFASEANLLGEKLGCVLVQLPPSLSFHAEIAARFFTQMHTVFACMLACEARHPSWFGDAATVQLQAHAITRVMADPTTGQAGPHEATTTASYRRLHGAPKIYYSAYADTYLARLRSDLMLRAHAGHPAWVIFDNTAAGAAQPNALAVLGIQPLAGFPDSADDSVHAGPHCGTSFGTGCHAARLHAEPR